MQGNVLTKFNKLVSMLRNLLKTKFSGRVEIHITAGTIRNVMKIESVDLAD